ncbi:MAG: hypothetical protein ACTSQB_06110 [Candidatus Heimdallarchaeota archaeon]
MNESLYCSIRLAANTAKTIVFPKPVGKTTRVFHLSVFAKIVC